MPTLVQVLMVKWKPFIVFIVCSHVRRSAVIASESNDLTNAHLPFTARWFHVVPIVLQNWNCERDIVGSFVTFKEQVLFAAYSIVVHSFIVVFVVDGRQRRRHCATFL